ncbi:ubiquitin-specific protease 2 [Wolffia australiana]
MGKKARAKGKTARRPTSRTPVRSPRPSIAKKIDSTVEASENEPCKHFNGEDEAVKRLLQRIQSSSGADDKCDDCRVESGGKNSRAKGKKVVKKGGTSKLEKNTIWVCLDCNHLSCGGEISGDAEPFGHARRHAKQVKHLVSARLDNPSIGYCFACNSSIPVKLPSLQNGEVNQTMDGGLKEEEKRKNEKGGGYSVRGLTNLGNTCFFNSVTQNLLAMEKLRSYFLKLNRPAGPLTMAMKKLFIETSCSFDETHHQTARITPNNLFGSVCVKAPQFKGYQQQDSHELLRYLLDGLSTEHSNTRKLSANSKSEESSGSDSEENSSSAGPGSNFVEVIFGGQLSSTVCCAVCSHSSVVFEPFLDLSLPIPWKKPPPRNAPGSSPRKGKLQSKADRVRRLREKRPPLRIPELEKAESSSSLVSETNHSSCIVDQGHEHRPESSSETGQVNGLSWMDFIESRPTSDNDEPISQTSASSTYGPQPEEEGSTISGLDFQPEVNKPQESAVILLPYEPFESGSCSKDGIPSAEEEFDGFGDLFQEEEGESAPAARDEARSFEEFGTSLLGGNSSESNHDEVDSSSALVSVDRCLAYFTTPELLSGEQAWNCEKCAKNCQFKEKKTRKEGSKGPECNGSVSSSCESGVFEEPGNGISLGSNLNEEESGGSEEECQSCWQKNTKRDATKRILIDKAPCVLTIHLKRFSQDSRGQLSKLSGHVSFQETLDLRPYMNSRSREGEKSSYYRLVGVVEHEGSMRGGHYVAYVRGEKSQMGNMSKEGHGSGWFYASDALVKEVSLTKVLQSEAYLLFYEKV